MKRTILTIAAIVAAIAQEAEFPSALSAGSA